MKELRLGKHPSKVSYAREASSTFLVLNIWRIEFVSFLVNVDIEEK